jgi:hypothetical protein
MVYQVLVPIPVSEVVGGLAQILHNCLVECSWYLPHCEWHMQTAMYVPT